MMKQQEDIAIYPTIMQMNSAIEIYYACSLISTQILRAY